VTFTSLADAFVTRWKAMRIKLVQIWIEFLSIFPLFAVFGPFLFHGLVAVG